MQGDSRDSDDRPMAPEKNVRGIITHEYDQDLVNLLPPIDTMTPLTNSSTTILSTALGYIDMLISLPSQKLGLFSKLDSVPTASCLQLCA
jgi:hypothetical protein